MIIYFVKVNTFIRITPNSCAIQSQSQFSEAEENPGVEEHEEDEGDEACEEDADYLDMHKESHL